MDAASARVAVEAKDESREQLTRVNVSPGSCTRPAPHGGARQTSKIIESF
jgi:hypothetical protein